MMPRNGRQARGSKGAGAGGFSLVELVVATAISTIVMAALASVLKLAYGRFGADTMAADTQQRIRVVVDALRQDLTNAAAVLPSAPFPAGGDAPGTLRPDVVTVIGLEEGASRSTIADALPRRSGDVTVNLDPGCPLGDAACGFEIGDTVVVFGAAGDFDPYDVVGIAGPVLTLSHLAEDDGGSHPAGASIACATVRSFFAGSEGASGIGQLVRQDAGGGRAPVADGITDVVFEYYGAGATEPLGPGDDLRAIRRIAVTVQVASAAGDQVVRTTFTPRNLGAVP